MKRVELLGQTSDKKSHERLTLQDVESAKDVQEDQIVSRFLKSEKASTIQMAAFQNLLIRHLLPLSQAGVSSFFSSIARRLSGQNVAGQKADQKFNKDIRTGVERMLLVVKDVKKRSSDSFLGLNNKLDAHYKTDLVEVVPDASGNVELIRLIQVGGPDKDTDPEREAIKKGHKDLIKTLRDPKEIQGRIWKKAADKKTSADVYKEIEEGQLFTEAMKETDPVVRQEKLAELIDSFILEILTWPHKERIPVDKLQEMIEAEVDKQMQVVLRLIFHERYVNISEDARTALSRYIRTTYFEKGEPGDRAFRAAIADLSRWANSFEPTDDEINSLNPKYEKVPRLLSNKKFDSVLIVHDPRSRTIYEKTLGRITDPGKALTKA